MPTRKAIRRAARRWYRDRYGPRQSQPVKRETAVLEDAVNLEARPGDIARALLELSERHGVSDEQLAALLSCTPEDVARRRADALAAAEHVAEFKHPADEPEPVATDARGALDTPAPTAPAAPVTEPGNKADAVLRGAAGAYMLVLLAAVLDYKSAFVQMISVSPLLSLYGLVVVFYISSRFLFSAFYRSGKDHGLEPYVAIVMPGFNEEAAIAVSLRSLLELDYPADKLEIVAVNDGSTDNTLREMEKVAATANGRVRVINFPQNRGKRAAMAAGIRATAADIVAFVDSDSVLDPHAMNIMVQGFHDPKVGAICGHANVLNVHENWMTKMQAVRYFVAFSVNKAAESVFNTVTCCSGCFSAYRREAIMPSLDWWENQKFLGRDSTFGDDRSLTNCVLRHWRVKYEARAISHTIVPNNFKQFLRQQLRWKRSWTRESLIVATFIWRKNPLAAFSAYVGILLPLVAPIVAVHAIIMMPAAGGGAPMLYLMGIYAMSVCYGLYYAARKPRYDALWVYGIIFCFFYLAFLLWQTYWAIATARSASWGTRPATAGLSPAQPGDVTS
jgi:hyaluronan synthase